jgi:lysophospholipase L1-like esterase
MISKPDFCDSADWERREIVFKSYAKSRASGDKNVYFIDGAGMFRDLESGDYTVDGTHPTDLGFYKMAEAISPVIKQILAKK